VRALLRILVGLSTLTWWVIPGMGIADLGVTWDEDWPAVLEAGWGLLCTLGLGLPLLAAALRPTLARAALTQLYVVAGTLAVAVLGGKEPEAWWFFVLLAIELPLLHLLARTTPSATALPNRRLLMLAAVAAPAALTYAWSMLAENRALHFDGDITMGVDHYPVQAALGLAFVALPAAAGLGAPGARLLGTSTALMAGYLGLVTYHWTDRQADVGEAWAVAAMAWATTVLAATWWPARAAQPDAASPVLDEQVA
jgi:hypothetical protein